MFETKTLPLPLTMQKSLGEVVRQVQIRLEGILSDTLLPSVGEKLREKGFAVSQWGVEKCVVERLEEKAPKILSFSYLPTPKGVNTNILLVVDSTSIATLTCTPPHHDTTTILISLPLTLLVSVVFAPALMGSAPVVVVDVVDLRITEHPIAAISLDGGREWIDIRTYYEPPQQGGYTILHKHERNFIAVDTLLCKAITSLVLYRAAQPLAAEIRRELGEKMRGYLGDRASVSITPTEKLSVVVWEGLVKFTYFDEVSIKFSSPPARWLAVFGFKPRNRVVSFPILITVTIYDNGKVAAEITKPQRFPGDAYITEYFMLPRFPLWCPANEFAKKLLDFASLPIMVLAGGCGKPPIASNPPQAP